MDDKKDPLVKGLVLVSRFYYLEQTRDLKSLKELLKIISTGGENYIRQPVIESNLYPQKTLSEIDKVLLEIFFDNDLEEFRKLGEWNSNNFVPRYFNIYIEEQNPMDFLEQFTRLRDYLIGSGTMKTTIENNNEVTITIEHGFNILRSVCLSEQGFFVGGVKLCGAKKVEIIEQKCASNSDSFDCIYKLKFQ